MAELWHELVDFPGYSISDHGRCRNEQTQRILTQFVNQAGVVYVAPSRDKRQQSRSVSLLVAQVFLDTPPHHSFDTPINLDGDRANNRADNLMWRPRWFAIQYARQFHEELNGTELKVHEESFGDRMTCWEAAQKYGLLLRDVVVSATTSDPNRKLVWPTYQTFRLI